MVDFDAGWLDTSAARSGDRPFRTMIGRALTPR
jgi:hypothetical protein